MRAATRWPGTLHTPARLAPSPPSSLNPASLPPLQGYAWFFLCYEATLHALAGPAHERKVRPGTGRGREDHVHVFRQMPAHGSASRASPFPPDGWRMIPALHNALAAVFFTSTPLSFSLLLLPLLRRRSWTTSTCWARV